MNKGKDCIDDGFVLKLFANQTFRQELVRFNKKETLSGPINNNSQPLVEEISQMLIQSYRESIDRQSFSLYQTYSQLSKEIESMKCRLLACESNKTECSSAQKQKQQDLSIFSEVSMDWEKEQRKSRNAFNFEERNRVQESSFIGSFLMDNGAKEFREQIEEKLKSSVLNLSGDLAKIETGIEQRLKNIEGSLNKKIQNIYKTLSNLIETINDMQSKGGESNKTNGKEKLNNSYFSKLLAGKLNTEDKVEKQDVVPPKEQKEGTRRRSFLGFNL